MVEFIFANIWLTVIVGVISIAVVVLSADMAVNKLTGLAGFYRLSTTFVGVTVVSLATSIPEIAAHYTASVGILRGLLDYEISSSVVLGSNIGSDVVQQTLIIAIVIFAAGTLTFKRYFLWKTMLPMILTAILAIVLGLDGTYSRIDGLILFGSFLLYMVFLYFDERKHYKEEDHGFTPEGDRPEGVPANGKEALRDAIIAVLAMVVTVASAMVALQATEGIVVRTGIGGSLIGVVTLGIASALPELTTAITGLRKGDTGIPLGTLIGSNITNPLVAIGGGAIISTYWVARPLVVWDLPWKTLTGIILWGILWFNKGKAGKYTAVYLTLCYVIFLAVRVIFFGQD
jgi:cation:H+ antiporter